MFSLGGEAAFRAPLGWDWVVVGLPQYILPPLPPGEDSAYLLSSPWSDRQPFTKSGLAPVSRGGGGVTRILSRDLGRPLVRGDREVHGTQMANSKRHLGMGQQGHAYSAGTQLAPRTPGKTWNTNIQKQWTEWDGTQMFNST